MAILVGIDEAGYGPLLGPLVVSAAAFELPDDLLTASLWTVLHRSVSPARLHSRGRLIIADSKKIHQGRGDYRDLLRNVLAALPALQLPLPQSLGQLLDTLQVRLDAAFDQYPWYLGRIAQHPLAYDSAAIAVAAHTFAKDLERHQIRFVSLRALPVCAGQFNHQISLVTNKARVLFQLVGQLIYDAYKQHYGNNLQIVVDRQGGRSYYRPLLQRMFPDLRLKILREDETTSSYQLAGDHAALKIHFLARGETRQLPIALASMTAKLVRELFMELLNSYFVRLFPTLAPTAGYYTDGSRFLQDLENLNWPDRTRLWPLLVRNK